MIDVYLYDVVNVRCRCNGSLVPCILVFVNSIDKLKGNELILV